MKNMNLERLEKEADELVSAISHKAERSAIKATLTHTERSSSLRWRPSETSAKLSYMSILTPL